LKEHLHEYDENWKCKCGQRLVVDVSNGEVKVKGFMTPGDKFVPLSEAQGSTDHKSSKRR
jgi:hypothetical protein